MGTRLRAFGLEETHGPLARELLNRVSLLEVVEAVVGRRTELPAGLRTLDALHLASMLFLRAQGAQVRIATYDRRLADASAAMEFEEYPLQATPPSHPPPGG